MNFITEEYKRMSPHNRWRLNYFEFKHGGYGTLLNDEDESLVKEILKFSEKYKEDILNPDLKGFKNKLIHRAFLRYDEIKNKWTYKDNDNDFEREVKQNSANLTYFYAVLILLLFPAPAWEEMVRCSGIYDSITPSLNRKRSCLLSLEDMIKLNKSA